MIENPYAQQPYKEAAWAQGFAKGLAAIAAPSPGDDIAGDDYDAFNDGVAAGADAAANGVAVDQPCVAAQEEGSPLHSAIAVVDVGHVLHSVWELRKGALVASFAGLLVALVTITVGSTVHAEPPEDVLPPLGQTLADRLAAFGADSLELYCGVALDLLSADCTMRMSPLFTSFDQAQAAAVAAGTPDGWIVVSWRTDQSNSFRVLASS